MQPARPTTAALEEQAMERVWKRTRRPLEWKLASIDRFVRWTSKCAQCGKRLNYGTKALAWVYPTEEGEMSDAICTPCAKLERREWKRRIKEMNSRVTTRTVEEYVPPVPADEGHWWI